MNTSLGFALLAAGTLAGLLAAFVLRTRLSAVIVYPLLGACGVCLGAGALLVLDRDVNAANWAATVFGGALIVPLHVWTVFGPPRAGATS
jgi:hypothetical protein